MVTNEEMKEWMAKKVFLIVSVGTYIGETTGIETGIGIGYDGIVHYCAGIPFDREWFLWAAHCEVGEYITSAWYVIVRVG